MDRRKDILSRLILPQEDNLATSMFNSTIEMIFFISAGLLMLVFMILFVISGARQISYWFFIAAIASMLLYSLTVSIRGITAIFRPTRTYIEELKKRLEDEDEVLDRLSEFAPAELVTAKRRLILEKDTITNRFGFILGAMDKLGLIPATIALYIAYSKGLNDHLLQSIPDAILMLFGGIYIGAFTIRHITERLSIMIDILERAEESVTTRRQMLT